MVAVVDHLSHDASTNIVGCSDMCFLGKLASKHAPTNHGGWLPSRRLGNLHAKLVTSSRPPIRYIMAV